MLVVHLLLKSLPLNIQFTRLHVPPGTVALTQYRVFNFHISNLGPKPKAQFKNMVVAHSIEPPHKVTEIL